MRRTPESLRSTVVVTSQGSTAVPEPVGPSCEMGVIAVRGEAPPGLVAIGSSGPDDSIVPGAAANADWSARIVNSLMT